MDRHQRLELFLENLRQAAHSSSDTEARDQLNNVLNKVEDRYSGVSYDPEKWQTDGRMYPPQDDNEYPSGSKSVRLFRSRGHTIEFGTNGSIRISERKNSTVVLDKPGSDGRTVEEMYKS